MGMIANPNNMSGLYLVPCESSGVFCPAIFCQVDEGAKVWCAAWATDPVLSATADVWVAQWGRGDIYWNPKGLKHRGTYLDVAGA